MDGRISFQEPMVLFQNHNGKDDGCISAEPVLYDNRIKQGRRRMPEINRRYFDGMMQDRKLSLRGLATKMGMSHSQLSLMFSGVRRAQIDEAAQLSQIFGEPIARIIENLGVATRPVSGRRVAVIGFVGGDGVVKMHDTDTVERTSAPEELPDDCIAVQFRTAGTALDWLDGIVCFSKQHRGIDPLAMGRCCLAKIHDGEVIVGTLKRGYRENSWNVSGPLAKESVRLDWATPILMTRH